MTVGIIDFVLSYQAKEPFATLLKRAKVRTSRTGANQKILILKF